MVAVTAGHTGITRLCRSVNCLVVLCNIGKKGRWGMTAQGNDKFPIAGNGSNGIIYFFLKFKYIFIVTENVEWVSQRKMTEIFKQKH